MASTRKGERHCFPLPWAKHRRFDNLDTKKSESNLISNGRLLREEIVSLCNGKNLPIHVFSAKEVMRMSHFTHQEVCHRNATYKLYRGVTENQSIYIKMFHELFTYVGMEGIIREIVIATQMGVHKNSLKLLGCCLETEFPILIFEFPEKGCLADQIHREKPGDLHWKTRLRIGYDISRALAYLQNGFHRPVIHRNLSVRDVFLDENYVAKVSGFDFCTSIPEGEEFLLDAVVGTTGYGAPEYFSSGRLTKKTDVYAFGVMFLELLAARRWFDIYKKGRDYCRDGRINKVLDKRILEQVKGSGKEEEAAEVLRLVSRCLAVKEGDRPDIVDVAIGLNKFLGSYH